jgi:hypothetical protein
MINLMLPREYRYKRHNVMLVAMFPGFSEKYIRKHNVHMVGASHTGCSSVPTACNANM